jgi:hypothetical protein
MKIELEKKRKKNKKLMKDLNKMTNSKRHYLNKLQNEKCSIFDLQDQIKRLEEIEDSLAGRLM